MLKGTLNTSNLPNHLGMQIIIALNGMVPFFRYLNLGPRARVLPLDSTPPSARARTHNIHNMCSITPIFTCVFGCICPWHTPIVSVHETYIHTYLHTYIQTYIHTCSVFSKGFCQQIQICCRIPLWEDEGKACCRKRTAYDSPMAIYLANIHRYIHTYIYILIHSCDWEPSDDDGINLMELYITFVKLHGWKALTHQMHPAVWFKITTIAAYRKVDGIGMDWALTTDFLRCKTRPCRQID